VPQVSLLRPGILLGKANRVRLKTRTARKMCFSAACFRTQVPQVLKPVVVSIIYGPTFSRALIQNWIFPQPFSRGLRQRRLRAALKLAYGSHRQRHVCALLGKGAWGSQDGSPKDLLSVQILGVS
jgi:hypothetical protein